MLHTARIQTNPSKAQQALVVTLTVVAIGMALAAVPLGFAGGAGLHRLLQPQHSPVTASVSNR